MLTYVEGDALSVYTSTILRFSEVLRLVDQQSLHNDNYFLSESGETSIGAGLVLAAGDLLSSAW